MVAVKSACTDEQLDALAAAVGLLPAAFGDIYDPWARKHGQNTFKILRVLNAANPHRAAFWAARENGYLDGLVDSLYEAHAFDQAINDAIKAGHTSDPVVVKLQANVDPELGLEVPMDMVGGGQVAVRRVGRILIDGSPKGTGFLVGPQVILTACHVVDSLFDVNGNELAGSNGRLEFEFERVGRDHPTERLFAAKHWLLAASMPHALETAGVPFDPDSVSYSGFDTCLDFALVRLERAVGRERGWYKLDEKVRPCVSSPGSRAVALLQHPGGASMRLGRGRTLRMWPEGYRTRVHHSANSWAASSGGLLLNSAYEMIGLHNATLEPLSQAANDAAQKEATADPEEDEEKVRRNAAVPTSTIAKVENVRNLANSIDGLDPVLRIPGTGHPVFGRDVFQNLVLQAVAGNKRILMVRGGPETGKSFSAQILKAMLRTDNHKYVTLQAADLSSIPEKLVAAVLQPLMVEDALASLPSSNNAPTATDAWSRDVLYPAMMEQLRQAAKDSMLWLIVDNIEINPLAQSSATHLLDRLFSEIDRYDFLRVVLLAPRRYPNAEPDLIGIDERGPPTAADVKQYVERRLQEVGRGTESPAIYVSAIMEMAKKDGEATWKSVTCAILEWFEQVIRS